MVASNVTNLHMELPTELTSKVTYGANKQGLKANLAKDTQPPVQLFPMQSSTLFWSQRKTDETREKVWTKSAQAAAAEMN